MPLNVCQRTLQSRFSEAECEVPLYGDYTSYPGVYGGVKLVHPEIGSWVIVKVGPHADSVYRVLSLRGHAYHNFYRVYVEHPKVLGLWYWPWEVEEWEELSSSESSDS